MKIIADSGSTKTLWKFLDEDRTEIKTLGFNPFFQSTEQISNEIQLHIPHGLRDNVTEVHYYGAGCSSDEKCGIVQSALQQSFPNAKPYVSHDLLAAARAICGTKPGIAAILGTGANTCYYNGAEIEENIASLGYVIGDEGSGAHIGKKLVRAVIHQRLPKELIESFNQEFNLTKDNILDRVYKGDRPNAFLASFARFCANHVIYQEMHDIVKSCFVEFFEHYIIHYKNYKTVPFGCVGSVGFYFKDILSDVAQAHNVRIGKVIESPMDELVAYHQQNQ